MKTTALFFPFDLFGSEGTRAGATLLADAFQEMLADNRRERTPTRARAYANKVRWEEVAFDTLADYQTWRAAGRQAAHAILERDDFMLWITGNHLGVLPVYEELGRRAGKTVVVQLDAHLDIYNLSDCTEHLSHGNFLLHAEAPLPGLVNLGHRELLLRPDYIAQHYQLALSAAEFFVRPEASLSQLAAALAQADRVFLDIDCDVLDPSAFPACSHPQPFGLLPHHLLQILDKVGAAPWIGLALSEFEPARDVHDKSLTLLMWLLEFVLLRRHEKK